MKGRAEALKRRKGKIPASMPAWFKSQGYTTIAVGKVSHYPGGSMGKNWDDASQPELPDGWTKSLMPVGELR